MFGPDGRYFGVGSRGEASRGPTEQGAGVADDVGRGDAEFFAGFADLHLLRLAAFDRGRGVGAVPPPLFGVVAEPFASRAKPPVAGNGFKRAIERVGGHGVTAATAHVADAVQQ